MSDALTYQWKEDDGDGRPDKVLAERLSLSRTQLQRWMEAGLVLCASEKVGPKSRLKAGDMVRIAPPGVIAAKVEAESIPLDVLLEDKDIIVLNKTPGMVVHPGAGVTSGTLVSALLSHCRGELSGIGGVERPGIVHRLDKDTSGVLVVAKNDRAHQVLSEQFKDRETQKTYLAWVCGEPRPSFGSWLGAIGRHPVHRQRMAVRRSGGREAHTDYRTQEKFQKASLLELRLHTGRTHQIRVHCAAAGCPVVGDSVYGGIRPWTKPAGVSRQLLHAWKLAFRHPKTQKTVEITAPLPEDFGSFHKFLKQS